MRVGFRLRSVNNKGLDLALKLPFDLMYLESRLRNLLKDKLYRGRIDIFSEIEVRDENAVPPAPVNRVRLAQLVALARTMAASYGISGELDINTVIRLPDLTLTERVGYQLPAAMEERIEQTLLAAVDGLLESRATEGAKLQADIENCLENAVQDVRSLAAMAQDRRDELRELIQNRIAVLLVEELDPLRLNQEVIFHADRLDISEEITRLEAHLGRTAQLIRSDQRPLGKQLDFLIQEQMREITTVGNKAKHEGLAGIVVKLKTEFEKIREQVQNLE
jgi:uncharacterized protein (TIGR00255 family)